MKKLKTCIIGYGNIARSHANALSKIEQSDLCGVYGRNAEKASEFAAVYGIPYFTDVNEMIDATGAEAAVICTPHPNHREAALKCFERKVHVISEKPLAVSLADCDEMIKSSETNGVKLGVISQRRYFPAIRRMKEAVTSGLLGKPILASVEMHAWRGREYYEHDAWRGSWDTEGGGILVNQGVHLLDILLQIMGDIDELTAYWSNFTHPYIEVDDTAAVLVRFKSGALGQITLSNCQNPSLYSKIQISGSNGHTVSAKFDVNEEIFSGTSTPPDFPHNDIWTLDGTGDDFLEQDRKFFSAIDDATAHFISVQLEDFISSVIENREPAVTGHDGRKVAELFNAVYISQKEKRTVKFPL